MNIDKISYGKDAPEIINVIIELKELNRGQYG